MRVLVVDDSGSARSLMKKALEKSGYEVHLAASGKEALNLVEMQRCFDLITLDLVMEGMDGYETCLQIRSLADDKKAETPIIFITGNDTMEVRQKGFSMGAADFLSKDNLLAGLSHAVDKILRPDRVMELRVLVVDDSAVVRKVMVNAMKEVFSVVDQAEDGQAAFEMIEKDVSYYDFIILDQDMPRMTGSQLTQKVRKELGLKEVPMVLVTGTQDRTKILEFFNNGGTDCLMKPYIKEELHARVRAHIDKAALHAALNTHISDLKKLNEQKNDYLAACSHDLKTPLNAIIGFTQLAYDEIEDDLVKKDLDRVVEAAGILHALIGNITDLYRVQSEGEEISYDSLNINSIVDDCVGLNKSLAQRKGVTLDFKPLPVLTNVRGNELALKRVLNNLISNALKFTEKGGSIEVKLKPCLDSVEVAVKDTGVGMSEQVRQKLFQKFSEASKDGTSGEKGVGLGLMITQQIVEQHGGEITVESEPGVGSSFSFSLQFASKEAA